MLGLKFGTSHINTSHRADIEGLRAIAILIVLAYHLHVPGFSGGYVGVDIFFVLSGFLITRLLVVEAINDGQINFMRFYARRARRLLPAMFVMLLFTVPVGMVLFAPFEQRVFANTAFSAAAYFSNIFFVREEVSYLQGGWDGNPYLHTWSLSVEEQFYFVWPLLVATLFGARSLLKNKVSEKNALGVLILITIASFIATILVIRDHQSWAFFLSPMRAWEFSVGGIIVFLAVDEAFKKKSVSFIVFSIGLLCLIYSIVLFDDKIVFPGFSALIPVLSTAVLILASSYGSNYLSDLILKNKFFQFVGKISYSLYLWHWPIAVYAFNYFNNDLSVQFFILALTLFFSISSYYLVENPIRRSQVLSFSYKGSLKAAAVLTIAAMVMTFSWRIFAKNYEKLPGQQLYLTAKDDLSEIYHNDCFGKYEDVHPNMEACLSGSKEASQTIFLIGDSHAASLYPAMKEISVQKDYRLLTVAKSACPYIAVPLFDDNLGREYDECRQWNQNVEGIVNKYKPEIVVITNYFNYDIGLDEYEAGLTHTIGNMAKAADRIILIRDVPEFAIEVPNFLARNDWNSEVFRFTSNNRVVNFEKSNEVFEMLSKVQQKFPNVFLFDINSYLFEDLRPQMKVNDFVKNESIKYFDKHHVSASFAKDIWQDFGKILMEDMK